LAHHAVQEDVGGGKVVIVAGASGMGEATAVSSGRRGKGGAGCARVEELRKWQPYHGRWKPWSYQLSLKLDINLSSTRRSRRFGRIDIWSTMRALTLDWLELDPVKDIEAQFV
jgi:hypothetical protein